MLLRLGATDLLRLVLVLVALFASFALSPGLGLLGLLLLFIRHFGETAREGGDEYISESDAPT
jgi:hypothetical protein